MKLHEYINIYLLDICLYQIVFACTNITSWMIQSECDGDQEVVAFDECSNMEILMKKEPCIWPTMRGIIETG